MIDYNHSYFPASWSAIRLLGVSNSGVTEMRLKVRLGWYDVREHLDVGNLTVRDLVSLLRVLGDQTLKTHEFSLLEGRLTALEATLAESRVSRIGE